MRQVITLDMDGSLFDSWACCGIRDGSELGTSMCRHLRADTLRKVRNIQAVYSDAELVVLSWRNGTGATSEWLGFVGIQVTAFFVPGSMDTRKLLVNTSRGQVGFKVDVTRALRAKGVEVVASFDDNPGVIRALRAEGFSALQVPRLVKISSAEWRQGHLNSKSINNSHTRVVRSTT